MEGLSEKSERKQTGAIVDFFIMSFLIILLDKKSVLLIMKTIFPTEKDFN